MTTDTEASLDEPVALIRQARAWLEWEQEWGLDALPPPTDIVRAEGTRSIRAGGASEAAARDATTTNGVTGENRVPDAPPARGAPEPRTRRLSVVQEQARTCELCGLHVGRTKSVFARGNPSAELVFVGEGPGYHEDQQGVPFVGRAGDLLDKMVEAMGFARDDVYVCNVVKCRPPENRTPLPDEAGRCLPFLEAQLEIVKPKVIVALGKTAALYLGCASESGRWRGLWRSWQGVDVMPTYHPAFLLRSPEYKRPVWEDLQQVLKRLGREPKAGG